MYTVCSLRGWVLAPPTADFSPPPTASVRARAHVLVRWHTLATLPPTRPQELQANALSSWAEAAGASTTTVPVPPDSGSEPVAGTGTGTVLVTPRTTAERDLVYVVEGSMDTLGEAVAVVERRWRALAE